MRVRPRAAHKTALATVASQLNKRATIFVAKRKREKWHERTLMAERLGATIKQVRTAIFGRFRNAQKSTAIRPAHF